MKIRNLWAASSALGIVLASAQFTPVLKGQSQSQPPSAQQDQQKTQVFVGKIIKNHHLHRHNISAMRSAVFLPLEFR